MRMLMRGVACLVIAAGAAGQDPGAIRGGEDRAGEAERFAGEWVIDSFEADGVKTDWPRVEGRPSADMHRLTIRGNRIEFVLVTLASGSKEEGTFSIVEVGPSHLKVDLDLVEQGGSDLAKYPDRTFVRKELWRLNDSGQFQRSFPLEPSGARPEGFATKEGDGLFIMTFVRRES